MVLLEEDWSLCLRRGSMKKGWFGADSAENTALSQANEIAKLLASLPCKNQENREVPKHT